MRVALVNVVKRFHTSGITQGTQHNLLTVYSRETDVDRRVGRVAGRAGGGIAVGAVKKLCFATDIYKKVKNTSSKNITFAKSEHPYRTSHPVWASGVSHEPPKSCNLGCNFTNFRSEN